MKLIVFDMDGTLLDSGAAIVDRVTTAFQSLGLAVPSTAAMRAKVGLSLAIYMAELAETTDPVLTEKLVLAYRAASAQAPAGQIPLFDGAHELLLRLAARDDCILGVATGKGRVGLDRALAQNGITHLFQTLQTPDNNPSKPDPGMLLTAMAECGAEPAQTVMIGDAVFDIDMAGAAGVQSIGVSWGMQDVSELRAAGATKIIDSFDQLEAIIDQLLE